MNVPYPGYSWSINQHIKPASNQIVLYELLKAAHTFSGFENYRELITEDVIDKGLLTENVRADQEKPQLWRDYQQVLPELGLIYSTKYTSSVRLTSIGLLFLDGFLDFKDMINTQVFKIQYPNGHKQDISIRLKRLLAASGIDIPSTNTELQFRHGILLKPAVLILRILLEQFKEGVIQGLGVEEVIKYLFPVKRNENWSTALFNLRNNKSNVVPDSSSKRHVQEWFRLLNLCSFFDVEGRPQQIRLTNFANSNLKFLESICEYHESINSFWITDSMEKSEMSETWFDFFGSSFIGSQIMDDQSANDADLEELEKNEQIQNSGSISLSSFDSERGLQKYSPGNKGYNMSPEELRNRIKGKEKIEEKRRLHDRIVGELAIKLTANNYDVYEDRKSVDLLAKKNNSELLFEIKTVTKKNLFRHLRYGNAQLTEYRYRRKLDGNNVSGTALVLSSTYDYPEWLLGLFNDEVQHALLGREKENVFIKHTEIYSGKLKII